MYFAVAQICCALTAPWAEKGKPPRPEDFVPYFEARPRQSGSDHAAIFRALAEAQAKGKMGKCL